MDGRKVYKIAGDALLDVARRYKAGETLREIALDYYVHPSTVGKALKRAGCPLRKSGRIRGKAPRCTTPQKEREETLKRCYGLTPEDVLALWTSQNGRCPICGKRIRKTYGKGVAIDHDHKSGTVRGLLCNTCNGGLGLFYDSTDCLRAAIQYLENSPKKCHDRTLDFSNKM